MLYMRGDITYIQKLNQLQVQLTFRNECRSSAMLCSAILCSAMLWSAMPKRPKRHKENILQGQAIINHSRIPNKLFGRNAKTVPVMEIMLATTTSVQSSACCLVLS